MREVLKVDKLTGDEVARYTGVTEAARANGMLKATVRRQCDEAHLPAGRYCLRWDGYDREQEFGNGRVQPVVVDYGGDLTAFPSITDAARALFTDRGNLSHAIKEGRPVMAGGKPARVTRIPRMGALCERDGRLAFR